MLVGVLWPKNSSYYQTKNYERKAEANAWPSPQYAHFAGDLFQSVYKNATNYYKALNPVLFLYVPSFIILFGMFMDTDFGDLPKVFFSMLSNISSSKVLAMVLAFFPIINPVIVVYFTEDYKRYLLSSGQVSTTQVWRKTIERVNRNNVAGFYCDLKGTRVTQYTYYREEFAPIARFLSYFEYCV